MAGTISFWSRGVVTPRIQTFLRVCAELRCHVGYMRPFMLSFFSMSLFLLCCRSCCVSLIGLSFLSVVCGLPRPDVVHLCAASCTLLVQFESPRMFR